MEKNSKQIRQRHQDQSKRCFYSLIIVVDSCFRSCCFIGEYLKIIFLPFSIKMGHAGWFYNYTSSTWSEGKTAGWEHWSASIWWQRTGKGNFKCILFLKVNSENINRKARWNIQKTGVKILRWKLQNFTCYLYCMFNIAYMSSISWIYWGCKMVWCHSYQGQPLR